MSAFLFLNPWLLAALAALPALWLLLRIMPPAPRKIFLPSARFLEGLIPSTQTPSKTPWWILLMRILIAGLVIFAFAQPVMNPSQGITGDNPMRIVVDNGWSSADIWDLKIRAAEDLLAQADRRGLSVYLNTTAGEPSDGKPLNLGPLSADEARSRLKGLSPLPWRADFSALNLILKDAAQDIDSYYLSDGINARNVVGVIETLRGFGRVHVLSPKNEHLPISLARGDDEDGNPSFVIRAAETMPKGTPITVQAQGQNGRVLGIESGVIDGAKTEITIALPDVLKRDLSAVRVTGVNSAASVYLFGDQFQKKRVGIATPQDTEARPFIEASFYLTRALEPYADLQTGDVDALLSSNVSMIVLADIGALSPVQLNRLEGWVRDGGLLLRFGGSAMEQTRQHFLLPTPLRQGARSLDGALAWENPPKLSEFTDGSPLSGIAINEDIVVRQQLLAQPAQDLPSKIWASLDDGTPLITADDLEAGMIVMVHTTASPDWSNLPLSGVFVQMLSRLVKIAGSAPSDIGAINGAMEPLLIMDGYGKLGKPESNAQIIAAADFEGAKVSRKHPPGIYGQASAQRALNLGDSISSISPLPDFGIGVQRSVYDAEYETNLMPLLLMAALGLLLVDWVVMIAISGGFRMRRFARAAAMIVLCVGMGMPAYAQSTDAFKHADGLYLGFIKSANAGLNAQTRRGLEALRGQLSRRTSAEPDGVAALDAENDILSFFPLLYWPVDAADQPLSDKALRNVQGYLDNGGTILFDTREDSASAELSRGGANAAALSRMIAGLNVPALAPIKDDHVLGRSFYLLDTFPGRYAGGVIWAEGKSANGRDGVSSVLIGSNDWASAWAESAGRNYRSGSSARQRELAVRFGVNVTMYALTGNYKADQVHVKHILERLGQ